MGLSLIVVSKNARASQPRRFWNSSVQLPSENPTVVEIREDDCVYRRLALGAHVKPDGSVSSNAYKLSKSPDFEPSVDLARLSTPEECLARVGRPGFGIGVLRVGDLISRGFRIRHEPTPSNRAHCIIEGNRSKETCYILAECTKLLELQKDG